MHKHLLFYKILLDKYNDVIVFLAQQIKQRNAQEGNTMKDYTRFMKWAVVYFVDRSTQDDRRSKLSVEALFSSPIQAEDNYIVRNPENKRYILHVDDLEEFETVYNGIQDLNEQYGEKAIFHLNELGLGCDKENKYRQILGIWTDTNL